MKTQFTLLITGFLVCILFVGNWNSSLNFPQERPLSPSSEKLTSMHEPSEHFFLQRSYPDASVDIRGYRQAMNIARRTLNQSPVSTRSSTDEWITEGPGNIGGRMNVVEIHPTNNNIIYVGSARGGIHKTTDGGQTWVPIFDDFSYLAIGEITLDPSNPDIVYVGTGDPNISGYFFIGDGVYKSMDAGQTWTYMGLQDQSIVSRIIVDPTDSLTVYAATMGLPMVRNNNRGLYKSTDGGNSWTQVLYVSNQAGIIDLVMDPFNSNTLYAASWDRIRTNQESTISGPGAGIWKSTDAGANWTLLTNGLPPTPQGRVGLTISQQTPDLVYAMYVDVSSNVGGVYRSLNAGSSWSNIIGDLSPSVLGGFGWYFGQIRVSPTNDNELWMLGVDLHRSQNTGSNWSMVGPPWWNYTFHADKHDLQFTSNGDIYVATDGGLYKSTDNGASWLDIENIPNTQFYRVALNPHTPGVYYGGTQDNGSTGGNAATINNWPRIYGGDGFQMAFDPNNSNIWYAETQRGGLVYSNNGGNNFFGHTQNIDNADRRNWDMPFMLSAFTPSRQYTGTYRVYRNTSGAGGTWNPISSDLTDGVIFGNAFHTISTVHESPVDENVLYAGTTDGNVWVSTNFGSNWIDVTGSLPDRYVTEVKASPIDSATAFVTHSGYKYNDFFPHIHKTTDFGANWLDISGDLPPLAINDVYIYPGTEDILFVATDGGVYGTQDAGTTWTRLGNNMPIIPVYDLEIDMSTQTLVAGTFARSLMTYNLGQWLAPQQPQISASGALSFCAGDSVVLSAPAGFAAYLWSNGDTTQEITVSSSGTFQVSVINACGLSSPVSDSTVVVVHPTPPQPTIASLGTLCEGGSIEVVAPLGYANYLWSNGQSGTDTLIIDMAINLALQVENGEGCRSLWSDTLVIEEVPAPEALFGLEVDPVNDLVVSFSDSSLNAQSYQWDFGDGTNSQQANPGSHTYTNYGSYTVSLIVVNECGTDTFSMALNLGFPDGIDEPNWTDEIQVFPNPASDRISVRLFELDPGELNIHLFDLRGRVVLQEKKNVLARDMQVELSLSALPAGVYVLSVSDGELQGSRRILIDR